VIGNKPSRQPHDLHIASGLALAQQAGEADGGAQLEPPRSLLACDGESAAEQPSTSVRSGDGKRRNKSLRNRWSSASAPLAPFAVAAASAPAKTVSPSSIAPVRASASASKPWNPGSWLRHPVASVAAKPWRIRCTAAWPCPRCAGGPANLPRQAQDDPQLTLTICLLDSR
jgi:hypothetical protein